MEWVAALAGVIVGAFCAHFLTLYRDKRQEAQLEATAMFELQRKCEEWKLHATNPTNFDTAFFSGHGIDAFLSKNWHLFGTNLVKDLSKWRSAVLHYLWYEHRKGDSNPSRQERLIAELEIILKKRLPMA